MRFSLVCQNPLPWIVAAKVRINDVRGKTSWSCYASTTDGMRFRRGSLGSTALKHLLWRASLAAPVTGRQQSQGHAEKPQVQYVHVVLLLGVSGRVLLDLHAQAHDLVLHFDKFGDVEIDAIHFRWRLLLPCAIQGMQDGFDLLLDRIGFVDDRLHAMLLLGRLLCDSL